MTSPLDVLQKYFGYSSLRSVQAEIMASILDGRDTLAILPTGGGKSICYQVPAIIMALESFRPLPTVTIVVSPLISLMKDQVEALVRRNIGATYLNSSLTQAEAIDRKKRLLAGEYWFLYLSPEMLGSKTFSSLVTQLHIPLVAVDEAHCVSEWGHDFRPEYRQISTAIDHLPVRPVVSAFTATATPHVERDISQNLKLQLPTVLRTSLSRSNLHFSVRQCNSATHQLILLLKIVIQHPDVCGIIYCATREKTEEMAQVLTNWGYPCLPYHGGMESAVRAQVQDDFLSGKMKLISATSAFGMGVDKPDVRFVIHCCLPGSLEAYYQEAGRAGRDGLTSECYLLACPHDNQVQEDLMNRRFPQGDRDPLYGYYKQRLATVDTYLNTHSCRVQYVLQYFGEEIAPCGTCCDNCQHADPQLRPDEMLELQRLDNVRTVVSQSFRCLPPQVLTIAQLHLVTLMRPQTKDEFLQIPGIGAGWIEKYYESFIRVSQEIS